jgi:hypothetical protein
MRTLQTDHAVHAAVRRLWAGLVAPGLHRAVTAYFHEPNFAGITFTNLGRNPPREIIPDDLLAVALLDITWRPQVVRILLDSHHAQLSEMLAAIPQAVDL